MSITTPREQRVWRYVAEELEELQQKYASPFYLRAKKDLGITTERIPQLLGDEPTAKGADRISPRSDRRFGRNTRLSLVALVPRDALHTVHSPSFASGIHARTRHRPRSDRPYPDVHEPDICRLFSVHRPRCHVSRNRQAVRGTRPAYTGSRSNLAWSNTKATIKAYGAGLLSSFGELEHAFSDKVERRPLISNRSSITNTPTATCSRCCMSFRRMLSLKR